MLYFGETAAVFYFLHYFRVNQRLAHYWRHTDIAAAHGNEIAYRFFKNLVAHETLRRAKILISAKQAPGITDIGNRQI